MFGSRLFVRPLHGTLPSVKHTEYNKWKARIAAIILLLALTYPLLRASETQWKKLRRGVWTRTVAGLINDSGAAIHRTKMGEVGAIAYTIGRHVPPDGTVGILMEDPTMGRAQFLLALRTVCYPTQVDFYDELTRHYATRLNDLDDRVFVLDGTPHRDPFQVKDWKLVDDGLLRSGETFQLLQFQPATERH